MRFLTGSILTLCCYTTIGQITLLNSGTSLAIGQISNLKTHIVLKGGNPSIGMNYFNESHNECQTIQPLSMPGPAGYLSGPIIRWDTVFSFLLLTHPNSPSTNTRIYRSSDNCLNWTEILDTAGHEITTMAFWSELEGIAAGTFHKLIRTNTGGQSWQTGPLLTIAPYALETFGDSTAIVGDAGGPILLSKDRGNSWTTIGSFGGQAIPRDFYMLNKDTIFGVSSTGNFGTNFTFLRRTGLTWQAQNSTAPMLSPYKVHFRGAKEGYVIGMNSEQDGIIALTRDQGYSWETFNTHLKTQLYDISFLNDSTALVCGSNGVLFKWNLKNTVYTGIEEDGIVSQTDIYPNPVRDRLNISYNGVSPDRLQAGIYDLSGRQMNFEVVAGQEIDVSDLENGVYLLKIRMDNKESIYKFIKEK